ncbi:STAS domain-containing protein [Rhizobium binxianense]|uniref:STAS domain-containing protein n=1 Tax=Rhizobium binxianense TaxID=3024242 RepID=UPI002362D5D2|nr:MULTISPECIES: STAS domain-containing protein [unclassified Rhizobium]MDC9811709.1 STAS domain-containing protein [Rhizobium sp. MC62]WEA59336.1 STAS domain-containing protein [Rhizobium sp. BJ04]
MDTPKQYYESIKLSDLLSIRCVSELYSKITDEFHGRDVIIIEIPESSEADLSFIQLIESARRQAKAKGKTFKLSSPASGAVLKVLERAGFIESFDKEDENFWLHKKVTL